MAATNLGRMLQQMDLDADRFGLRANPPKMPFEAPTWTA